MSSEPVRIAKQRRPCALGRRCGSPEKSPVTVQYLYEYSIVE